MKETVMKATMSNMFARIYLLLAMAGLIIVFSASPSAAQGGYTINSFDKGTPAESKAGLAGISTYGPDKVETVNLANGNLSMQFPLATIGGRGSAAYTIALSYNSKLWSGEYRAEFVTDPLGGSTQVNHFSAVYDDGTLTKPNLIALGSGWFILKGPAVRSRIVFSDPVPNPQIKESPEYRFVLTRVWLTLPDGGEVELRDAVTNGAPFETAVNPDGTRNHRDRDRGRIWISTDGSAITYVTDADNGVVDGLMNGWVYLSDGTRIRMRGGNGGDASARCREIIDRDGNMVNIDYDLPVAGATTYTDQLGRQFILQPTAGGASLTIKGYNDGVLDRTITIDREQIAPNLTGPAPNLRADYQNTSLYPRRFTGGDYSRSFFGEVEHTITEPHVDLFSGSEGGEEINAMFAVVRLNLLDGRKFHFRYNPWGEVAEIVYPAGGISQIDYAPHGSPLTEAGPVSPFLNRRVSQRRLLADGSTVEATWNYTRGTGTVNGTPYPTITVIATQGASGPQLMREIHYFLDLDAEYRYGNFLNGFNGMGYEKWENAKEHRVERFINGTLKHTEDRVWQQRATVSWPDGQAYVGLHGQEQPPLDTRTVTEDMTLENGKLKRMSYSYDRFNNVTQITERDWGTGGPGPTLRQIIRTYAVDTTVNGYCYSNLNGLSGTCSGALADDPTKIIHIRRMMLTEEVKDGGGTPESFTVAEYDNYQADAQNNHAAIVPNSGMIQYKADLLNFFSAGFQPRGNVTRVRRQIVGATNADTYSFYDQAGNVVKIKDPLGRETVYSYTDNFGDGMNPNSGAQGTNGATFATLTLVRNALNHEAKTQYHYTRGVATGVRDANDVFTRTEYNDPYDRPTKVTAGFNKTGTEQVITEMSYPTAAAVPGMPVGSWTRTSKQFDTTRWLSSATKTDGFGRPVEASQTEDGLHFNSANFTIHAKTIYDGLGRVVKATNPYRSTSAPTDGWTRTTYDLAGRVIEVATSSGSPSTPPPDTGNPPNWTGSVVTTYASEVTTVRDQAGKQRRSTIDALGRLKVVEELNEFPSGAAYAVTSYSYDARGNLKQVNQNNNGQFRNFSYDGLSRLTSASNPESGNITYTYDLASNLKTKFDARSITTTYTYDDLNRLRIKDYSGTTTPDVTYNYDPAIQYGKGRLASVTNGVSSYSYTAYDALGRVTQYAQTTAGNLYPMSCEYNKAGAMTLEEYPSQKMIETQYDGAGRIAGVKQAGVSGFFAGAASSDATNRLQYTAHGAVSVMKLGNGLWEHTNFNSRLQPTQIGLGATSMTSGVLQLDYGYGATASNNGNITTQQIIAPGLNVTQSYTYDQINRLLSASEGTNWTQNYLYDQYGNRAVAPGSYILNGALTPQTLTAFNSTNNRIQLSNFAYDQAGNLTADPDTGANGMVYDAENRMTSYTKSGLTTTYAYDGDGRRVSKTDSTGTLVFVYNASGQLIAEYSTATQTGTLQTSYLTTDHLGSTRVVTNDTGGVKSRHDLLPFGEEIGSNIGGRSGVAGYAAQDSTRQRFTSYERDNESSLDFAQARYYSAAQGRFTSTDPVLLTIERLTSPQEINLYAYTRNNPLAFIDPTGEIITFADEDAKKKFEEYEKSLNKDSKKYAAELDTIKQLKDSDVEYQIKVGGSFVEGAEGNLTTDGTRIFVNISNVGGAYGEVFSLNSRFAHELEHARQFENGEIAFSRDPRTGEWNPSRSSYDIGDEVKAWQAQQNVSTNSDYWQTKGGSREPSTLSEFSRAKTDDERAGVLARNGYPNRNPNRDSNVRFSSSEGYKPGQLIRPTDRPNFFGRVHK